MPCSPPSSAAVLSCRRCGGSKSQTASSPQFGASELTNAIATICSLNCGCCRSKSTANATRAFGLPRSLSRTALVSASMTRAILSLLSAAICRSLRSTPVCVPRVRLWACGRHQTPRLYRPGVSRQPPAGCTCACRNRADRRQRRHHRPPRPAPRQGDRPDRGAMMQSRPTCLGRPYKYCAPASAAKRLGSPSQTIRPCSST